jgi:tetratricopeptide (TPR) repeat protein
LSFPFQLYGVLTTKSRTLKWLFGLFSGLSLFLLIVLSNRAAWLALLTGFGLIILLEVWRRKITKGKTVFKRKTVRNFAAGLFSVLILSTLFFTFFTETSEAEKHLSGITSMESGSGKDRIELWKRTANIIEEKPLFGCGAANWKIEMLKYGSKGLVSENNITFYQRPHNDFLWIFSEYGLVGGLLYLSLFVIAFTMLVVQLMRNKEQKLALFYYTLVFALTGFVIFSFLSFPHERIVHNILLSSFFAVIVSSGIKEKAVISPSGKAFLPYVFYFVSTTLIVVSLFVGYQRFVSESHTRNALFARMENEHETVIAEIRKANSPYYRMDPLSTPLSWYEGMAWYESGQADSALKYFSEAHQLNPYYVHVLNNLASAYAQIGKNDTAILYYKEALNIYPEFEDAALNLCAIYYNTGQTDSAFLVLKKVNINTENPNFKVFLKAVLKAQFVKLLQEQGKADWISYLPEDKEWYYRQYKISASQNKPIKSFTFESPDYFNY